MRPIKIFFQDLFKFMKRNILAIFSKQLGVFCLCYRHASFFPVYTFRVFPATYAFHLCVEYDNQNESLKTRYIRLLKHNWKTLSQFQIYDWQNVFLLYVFAYFFELFF